MVVIVIAILGSHATGPAPGRPGLTGLKMKPLDRSSLPAALLLVLLAAAWIQFRRPRPFALTPTLTGQVEYCLTCHGDLPEISTSHPVADLRLRALSRRGAAGFGRGPGAQQHARRGQPG